MHPNPIIPHATRAHVIRQCEWCDQTFFTTASQVKHRGGRFCSKSCAAKAKKQLQDATFDHKAVFLSRIEETPHCWLYTGYITKYGYGKLRVHGKVMRAHRFAYQLFVGPIPEGLIVRHRCHNPACVNPEHLVLGTNADNSRDMVEAGRQRKGENHPARLRPERMARGEKNGSTKLNAEIVLDIRRLRAEGVTLAVLAERHGVAKGTISQITLRKIWKHI